MASLWKDAFYLLGGKYMKVKYAGKEFEIADGANGFDAAKVVDPEKKNKALAYKIGEKIFDMREPLRRWPTSPMSCPKIPKALKC
jgi:hypothetical protein